MDTNRFLRQLAEFLRETAERRALEWRNEIGEAGWVPCPSSPPRWSRAAEGRPIEHSRQTREDHARRGSTGLDDVLRGPRRRHALRRRATGRGYDAWLASSTEVPNSCSLRPGRHHVSVDNQVVPNHIAAIEVEHIGAGIHSSKRTMDRPSASPSPPGGRVEEWSAKRHERSARETLEPECTVPVTE